MNAHEEFWARVNELLDARADPLEDAQVQRELERSPELLDELLELRSALGTLAKRRRPLRTVSVSVAAVAAAAAIVVLMWRRVAPQPGSVEAPLDASLSSPLALAPRFAPIPPGVLLELRATFTLSSASGERIEHIDFIESRSSVERRELGPHGQLTLIALAHHPTRVRQP